MDRSAFPRSRTVRAVWTMVALLVVVTPVLDLAGVARGNAGGGTACCPLQANPGLPVTVPITISAPVLGPVQSFVRLPRIPLLAVSIFIPPRA